MPNITILYARWSENAHTDADLSANSNREKG